MEICHLSLSLCIHNQLVASSLLWLLPTPDGPINRTQHDSMPVLTWGGHNGFFMLTNSRSSAHFQHSTKSCFCHQSNCSAVFHTLCGFGEIQCFSTYLDHVLVSSSSCIKCFPLNRGWDTQQRIVQTLYLFKIFSFFCVCDPFVYPLSPWASNANAVELVH